MIYLPLYVILTSGKFAAQYLLMLSYDKNDIDKRKVAYTVIAFNLGKLLMTGTLCFYSLKFCS